MSETPKLSATSNKKLAANLNYRGLVGLFFEFFTNSKGQKPSDLLNWSHFVEPLCIDDQLESRIFLRPDDWLRGPIWPVTQQLVAQLPCSRLLQIIRLEKEPSARDFKKRESATPEFDAPRNFPAQLELEELA